MSNGLCKCPTSMFIKEEGSRITCTNCNIGWTTSGANSKNQQECFPCDIIPVVYATEAESPFLKGSCKCKDNTFTKEGNGCVKNSDIQTLEDEGFGGEQRNKVFYFDVMNNESPPVKSEAEVDSSVFRQFYI